MGLLKQSLILSSIGLIITLTTGFRFPNLINQVRDIIDNYDQVPKYAQRLVSGNKSTNYVDVKQETLAELKNVKLSEIVGPIALPSEIKINSEQSGKKLQITVSSSSSYPGYIQVKSRDGETKYYVIEPNQIGVIKTSAGPKVNIVTD